MKTPFPSQVEDEEIKKLLQSSLKPKKKSGKKKAKKGSATAKDSEPAADSADTEMAEAT